MTFSNDKKTFLSKLDKSKKGEIDQKVVPLIDLINSQKKYYTTSSCSGRVYLWQGSGKKNETEWLRVSHDLITERFFEMDTSGLTWLRVEPFIMHICCQDLESANELLNICRTIFKKSCLLSVSNKIIVEIRGSEFIELPLYQNHKLLFNDLSLLKSLVNEKLKKNIKKINRLMSALLADYCHS